ncbi:MAG: PorV/PorQ family protein, partial [Ignavibacteriae bacterium]|nr:PorV/PorQ family protein [Ignavibacteriota bacterium]
MKKIIIMLSMLISCINVDAQFNKVGRTALQFLKIGMGARQAAQGEASIANHQDINSIFWNPAAITNIDNIQASFNYTSWISDLKVLSGGIGLRLGEIGIISFGVIQMDYGDLDEAITTSTSGGLDTRTGLKFGGSDLALSFGFARNFTNKLSIGVNIKYIREELHTFSSNVWAFDVGSYYETGWKGIRLG